MGWSGDGRVGESDGDEGGVGKRGGDGSDNGVGGVTGGAGSLKGEPEGGATERRDADDVWELRSSGKERKGGVTSAARRVCRSSCDDIKPGHAMCSKKRTERE